LDICVAVGKYSVKYPFLCDNYLNYVLRLKLCPDSTQRIVGQNYMTVLRIVDELLPEGEMTDKSLGKKKPANGGRIVTDALHKKWMS
jgi:hypothetical protein